MSASLPDLQPVVNGAGATAGSRSNVPGIQQDGDPASAFGPILEQASTEPAGAEAEPAGLAPEVEQLASELQMLPEDGKLLPLLQQVYDRTAAAGGDPAKVLEAIAGDVRALQSESSMGAAEALAVVLPPYLNDVARAVVSAAPVAAGAGASLVPASREQGGRTAVLPAAGQSLARTPAQGDADSGAPAPLRAPEPALAPVETAARHESPALAAALRQFTGSKPSADGEGTAKSEPLTLSSVQSLRTADAAQNVAAPRSVSVEQPVNQAGWDEALGEKIQWLVSQRVQGAQIRLNPQQLGPMEVNIQVRNDQATIQFSSAHAVVRDALEAAIPRLRDMMESSGVQLVDVDVSGQSSAGHHAMPERNRAAWNPVTGDESLEAESRIETSVATVLAAGRLDLFA